MPLDLDDLVDRFTLLPDEAALLRNKSGSTRLGFALLLKFFTFEGRFPTRRSDFAPEVVDFVARQVGVPATELASFDLTARQAQRHRSEIRHALGFRECSVADAEKLTDWLVEHVAQVERRPDRVEAELLVHCRNERIEPPAASRVDRIVGSALRQGEHALLGRIVTRIPDEAAARMRTLVEVDESDDSSGPSLLSQIKAEPGNVSLDSMLVEIDKLESVRAVGLPSKLFDDIAPKIVTGWRSQAMLESPSHLRAHSNPAKTLVLLAALLQAREQEITDVLVELLISVVHRIAARAERKVTEQLVNAFKRVTGKENILFAIADASLAAPDRPVREVIFPAVSGGEQTLRELVHEFKTKGPVYQYTKKVTLRASYTGHYRKGLVRLLSVLEFRSNNSTHRPVIEALELVGRYAHGAKLTYYPLGEHVPSHRGVTGDWSALAYAEDKNGNRRNVRMVYEICTFQALRDALRCREIWVPGSKQRRNPEDDLPADFDSNRVEHYRELRKPLDPSRFINELRQEMHHELTALSECLPGADWLDISERRSGAIKLSPIEPLPEPRNLRSLKAEVARRWGTVPLIDMLKETALRTGCLDTVAAMAGRRGIPADVLIERLMLVIYAYGTNAGIKAVAAGGHGHDENDLRYARRRYLSIEAARAIATAIADATFAARAEAVWGAGSTAVASDSTHFAAFDQNIFTEWHSRYRGRGVLIYWHVEKGSVVVHSQHLSCSASEVAAMVEGVIRHGTTMNVEANYVDSHGQSEIGFGITRLLGFDLLPRIKRINKVRLYRPTTGNPTAYPGLEPAMVNRAIRWDLIAEQYDQMIKYATAIRLGTASTETILRRFTSANSMHPTYQAMAEVGRAQKTIFVARYLRDRDLQREINDGLNVVESWNRANEVIFFGNGRELASNHRDEQELSMWCLRILQAALVYINTLMIQDVLAESQWMELLADADKRAVTPLFWGHVQPYGDIRLDMTHRMKLAAAGQISVQ